MGIYSINGLNSNNGTPQSSILDVQPSTVIVTSNGSLVNVSSGPPTIDLRATSIVTINGNVSHYQNGAASILYGAVNFDAGNFSTLTVGPTGSIFAYQDNAVTSFSGNGFVSGTFTVNNAGTITATGASANAIRAYNVNLNNSGLCGTVRYDGTAKIYNTGQLEFVVGNVATATSTITNAGHIDTVGGNSTQLSNTGTIDQVSLFGFLNAGLFAAATITNSGTIGGLSTGSNNASAGNLTYYGQNGSILGTVYLHGAGHNFYGGNSVENVTIYAGTDTIDLGGGNDSLSFDLAGGNGTLEGGAGTDAISYRGIANPETFETTYQALIFDLASGTIDDAVTGETRYTISGFENVTAGGANDTIIGNAANNVLDGGTGIDTMSGGLGNDTFFVDNAADVVNEAVGQGADLIRTSVSYALKAGQEVEFLLTTAPRGTGALNLTGNDLNNSIQGNDGANVMTALGGNDTLRGFAGADTLRGGLGNDLMFGGAGADVFVFNAALNATTNVDRIADFAVADDIMHLENTGAGLFNALAAGGLASTAFWSSATGLAHDGNDRIVYNSATGAVFYDADGTGAVAAVKFAQLNAGLGLTNLHFFVI